MEPDLEFDDYDEDEMPRESRSWIRPQERPADHHLADITFLLENSASGFSNDNQEDEGSYPSDLMNVPFISHS